MQARSLIPQDRIHFVIIGSNAQGGTLNKDFTFDGTGAQLTNGEADGSLPGLQLPPSAFNGGGGGRGVEPVLDTVTFMQLVKANRKAEADAMTVAFKAAYDAYTGQGGQPLGDTVIDACFAFVERHVTDLRIGGTGNNWNLARANVVARIPNRATPTTPIMIVVQPTPSWGK